MGAYYSITCYVLRNIIFNPSFLFVGNVFIHRNEKFLRSPESGMESCEEFDDEEVEETPAIVYKIGKVAKKSLFSMKFYNKFINDL